MKFRTAIPVMLVCSSLAMSGCTLIDPFVTWEPLEEAKQQVKLTAVDVERISDAEHRDSLTRALAKIDLRTRDNVSMAQAMAYANRGKAAYNAALSEHAEVQSYLGIGLIPLTAAAMGLGATGGSTDLIIGLGLAGAATYGTGTWLLNKPRQAGYVAGLKALTCAQQAVEPFDMPLIDQVSFEAQLEQLNAESVAVGEQLAVVEGSIASVDNLAVQAKASGSERLKVYAANAVLMATSAKAQVSAVNAVLTTAGDAHLNGVKLQRGIESAGRKLANSVNKIAGEVAEIINETQKDPQALATIIQGLGQSYATFTTVPKVLRPAPEPKTASDEELAAQSEVLDAAESPPQKDIRLALLASMKKLSMELVQLGKDVAQLTGKRGKVAGFVNAVVSSKPTATLESCGVSKESLISDLTIDPAGPFSLPGGKPGSVGFTVKGGQSPYGANLGGGQVKGLTVTQMAPFSPVVTVTSDGSIAAGKFVVNVVDGSGRATVVPIEIAGGAAEEEQSGDNDAKLLTLLNDMRANIDNKPITVSGVSFTVIAPCVDKKERKIPVELDPDPGTTNKNAIKDELIKSHENQGGAKGITREHIVFGKCS